MSNTYWAELTHDVRRAETAAKSGVFGADVVYADALERLQAAVDRNKAKHDALEAHKASQRPFSRKQGRGPKGI